MSNPELQKPDENMLCELARWLKDHPEDILTQDKIPVVRTVEEVRGSRWEKYKIDHGNPSGHRGTDCVNRIIATERGSRAKQIAPDGFSMSRKGRKRAKQARRQGKYG